MQIDAIEQRAGYRRDHPGGFRIIEAFKKPLNPREGGLTIRSTFSWKNYMRIALSNVCFRE
jgi:hypothetical protein